MSASLGRRARKGKPVLAKCCLRASGRGRGTDSEDHVHSNGRRQNLGMLDKPTAFNRTAARRRPCQPGQRAAWAVLPTLSVTGS